MRTLPRHHIDRPRLAEALGSARVGVVLAPGGWGKSLLAAEIAGRPGVACLDVEFSPGDDASFFAAAMGEALGRTGLSEALAAVTEAPGDGAALADALLSALERETGPVLVALDDVQWAGREGGRLLTRLAQRLAPPHRLLVLGRALPPGADEVAESATAVLGTDELALTVDEISRLSGVSLGAELPRPAAAVLQRATAGWAAAVGLALQRLARADDPLGSLRQLVERGDVLAHLLADQLDELDEPQREAVVQLAHLPLVSRALATRLGAGAAFDAAVRAGVPFSPRSESWWQLPGPVQEHLAELAPLQPETARAAAAEYAERNRIREAVQVLLTARLPADAASLLADLPPQRADRLGYLELHALVNAIPAAEVEHRPEVLLHLARACEPVFQTRVRAAQLERALAAAGSTPTLTRAVQAEIARDLVRDAHPQEAEELATRTLAETTSDELATRARLLDVLGRALAWRRDEASLLRAEPLLEEAALLCRNLGEPNWEAQVLVPLAYGVLFARGEFERACQRFDEVLRVLPGRSRQRPVVLTFYADVLLEMDRLAEAEAVVAEALALAELFRDARSTAYSYWQSALISAQRRDRTATLDALRRAERAHGDWFETESGVDFLCDAATLADYLGEADLALDYLERADARRAESPLAVAVAEAVIEARSGDPEKAERLLADESAFARLEPKNRWWLTLMRAHAAVRRGDVSAGAIAAQAFEEAAALGQPQLPLTGEPEVAAGLLDLAAASGSRSAVRLRGETAPLHVTTLGRFEVRRGGLPLALPPGKPEQLVKLLAAAGGRIHVEQAIEELWAGVEPASGRKRLRNTLNRLRQADAEIVVRDGETLALGRRVAVDAADFEREANAARAAAAARDPGAALKARAATARFTGTFLPDELYAPWATATRDRLAACFLDLLDLTAAAAEARGELDEAVRLLERMIELDPLDDRRPLRLARLLVRQDRRARALAVLDRAEQSLAALGLEPGPAHVELVRTITGTAAETARAQR